MKFNKSKVLFSKDKDSNIIKSNKKSDNKNSVKDKSEVNSGRGIFFSKEKVLFVVGLVMMVFSSCISVFAASFLYNSNEVSFNNSSSPSISSNNVQGAIDELYSAASDYSALQTRVAALEGHWHDDDRYLVVKSTGANNSGLILRDATDTNRGSFQYNYNGYSILESRDSTGTLGKGELQIKGKPITLDATTGGTGNINLNGNVKVNGTSITANNSTGGVNVKSYTESNMYTFPYDGYVTVNSGSGATAGTYIRLAVTSANGQNVAPIYMIVNGSYQLQSVFVKKGMKCYVYGATASNYSVTYYPLTS